MLSTSQNKTHPGTDTPDCAFTTFCTPKHVIGVNSGFAVQLSALDVCSELMQVYLKDKVTSDTDQT